jgi:hypothetical protein
MTDTTINNMPIKKIIVALLGKRGCGKSTAASQLVEKYGFAEYSFAEPLKQVCSTLLGTPLNWFTDINLKEKVIPNWNNTPRYFMQKWGTEIFRDYMPVITPEVKSIWVDIMLKKINNSNSSRIVISDCRFDNELTELLTLENYKTHSIQIVGQNRIPDFDGNKEINEHISEKMVNSDLINYTINNTGDIACFNTAIEDILTKNNILPLEEFEDMPLLEESEESEEDIIIDTDTINPSTKKLIINGIDQTHLINPSYVVESSALIGKKGEQYVLDIIKNAYPEVEAINISAKARAGDIIFRPHLQSVGYQSQIMIEVKKYSRKVPTQEYDKFLRDIRESNHDAGIFISLTSEIVGITDSIVIKTINTERDGRLVPVIIACTDNKEIISSLLSLIIGYITLICKQSSYINQTDFAVQIISSLQSSLNNYNTIRTKVHELRINNDHMLDIIQDSLTSNYTEIRLLLNQLHGMVEVKSSESIPKVNTKLTIELKKPVSESNTKSAISDAVIDFGYPVVVSQFLLKFSEKFEKQINHGNILIEYSEKTIKIIGNPKGDASINEFIRSINIELAVLKTKVNCTIGKFKSDKELHEITNHTLNTLIGNKKETLENPYNGLPFDNVTISPKYAMKFELFPKYIDIVLGYLTYK